MKECEDHALEDQAPLIHTVLCADWQALLTEKQTFFATVAQNLLSQEGFSPTDLEISVVWVDADTISQLNHQHRQKDKATNVLSFAQFSSIQMLQEAMQRHKTMAIPTLLGEVFLCYEVIEREALEQNKSIFHHVAHMLVHGLYHLLGYDHQTDAEATVMEAKETALLKVYGIKDPYATAG